MKQSIAMIAVAEVDMLNAPLGLAFGPSSFDQHAEEDVHAGHQQAVAVAATSAERRIDVGQVFNLPGREPAVSLDERQSGIGETPGRAG